MQDAEVTPPHLKMATEASASRSISKTISHSDIQARVAWVLDNKKRLLHGDRCILSYSPVKRVMTSGQQRTLLCGYTHKVFPLLYDLTPEYGLLGSLAQRRQR